MTPEEREEGRRLLAEATEGPWELDASGYSICSAAEFVAEADGESDRAFIVWARNHLAELLDAQALLAEMYPWALSACGQGARAPYGAPEWHSYIGVWQDAEDLLPRVAELLGVPIPGVAEEQP